MLRKSVCCLLACVCLTAGPWRLAWADGDSRPAEPSEKAFFLRVLQTFAKACPAGPTGWDVVDQTEVVAPDFLGMGAEETPLMVTYQVSWQDTARLEGAQEQMINSGAELIKKQQEDQSSQQTQAQFEQLVAALAAAMEKGDYAQAQKIQLQLESVSKKLDAVYAGRAEEIRGVEEAYAPHDAKVEIIITANSFSESFARAVKPGPKPAGLTSFRSEGEQDPHNGWQEGVTTIFVGEWQMVEEDDSCHMEAVQREDAPYDAVQTVVVQVQADEARAQKLIETIDWEALKSLLAQ